jgi:uncharacterized protein YeaO (DUF488 family)
MSASPSNVRLQRAYDARRGRLTLVLGAHDTEHSQALVVADELERRLVIVGRSAP